MTQDYFLQVPSDRIATPDETDLGNKRAAPRARLGGRFCEEMRQALPVRYTLYAPWSTV